MPLPQHEDYTTEDIYHLPEGTRAELIDGQIYYMAPPTRTHQKLLFSISRTIADYIDSKKGICEVDIAPFAVFLNEDNQNYVEPDISVICDTEKLSEKGCTGAPENGLFHQTFQISHCRRSRILDCGSRQKSDSGLQF